MNLLLLASLSIILFIILRGFYKEGFDNVKDDYKINYKYYGGYKYKDPVYWPLHYGYGKSNTGDEKGLFSAHPRKMVCSHPLDERMKHIRLNHTGGVMYTSYNPPNETSASPKCEKVECPPLVTAVTPHKIDHFNPYPVRRDKTTCYKCY